MAATSNSKPTWQDDECPSWCATQHREDDLPEDRVHDSPPVYVPVVVGPPPEAAELLIITSRRCGTTDDWTFVGRPDQTVHAFTISPESARRMAQALLISL